VAGYADDRLADGVGWGSFDVRKITCPVAVLHGGSDNFVPVAHAQHTAAIVPGATLRVFEPLGHFSICSEVVRTVSELVARVATVQSPAAAP
jgi:pimeloyl-ACP methyl ester carboxylesterase